MKCVLWLSNVVNFLKNVSFKLCRGHKTGNIFLSFPDARLPWPSLPSHSLFVGRRRRKSKSKYGYAMLTKKNEQR